MSRMIKSEDLVRALRENKFIEMDASAFECICDIIESIPSAELEPIDMETIKAEAYNRGIDSERKRIAEAWCKAEYERGYKDGQESAERKGEWIDCKEPPSTDRNVFIAYGTDDMKSVCIGHYEHDMKLWYEDKNFFAKPIYDAMYWCEIPQFPARMKGADDE